MTYLDDFSDAPKFSVPLGVELTGSSRDGWVYFIGLEETGMVKIGWTRDPRQRVKAMQTDVPLNKIALLVFGGSTNDERALHKRFADLRTRREWFLLEPGNDLDVAIRAAKKLLTIADMHHNQDLTDLGEE